MSYYNHQQPPVGVPPPQGYPPEVDAPVPAPPPLRRSTARGDVISVSAPCPPGLWQGCSSLMDCCCKCLCCCCPKDWCS